MARPRKCRKICREPFFDRFSPEEGETDERVILTVDEYEAIRLVDYEGRTHEQCAEQMEIARTTVTEMYEEARRKIADCLVNGKNLFIVGGHYRLCEGSSNYCCRELCHRSIDSDNVKIHCKGEGQMRIAVTYDNGDVFQHFGHTECFQVYDVEEGKIVRRVLLGAGGRGHGALAEMLREKEVDTLICGGIGGGAKMALSEAGISLYAGVSGSADKAVKEFLDGNLNYNPDEQCSHHEHSQGHDCESHSCGSHKCGE